MKKSSHSFARIKPLQYRRVCLYLSNTAQAEFENYINGIDNDGDDLIDCALESTCVCVFSPKVY